MLGYSKFHIVYPRGVKTKLAVVEICSNLEYELSDYAVASRQSFFDEDEANSYAKQLANDNGLTFEFDGDDYLD